PRFGLLRTPPSPTPLPYTTLFRSGENRRFLDQRRQVKRLDRLQRKENTVDNAGTQQLIGHGRGFGYRVDPENPGDIGRHAAADRSEEHTSELQSRFDLVCRLLLEK